MLLGSSPDYLPPSKSHQHSLKHQVLSVCPFLHPLQGSCSPLAAPPQLAADPSAAMASIAAFASLCLSPPDPLAALARNPSALMAKSSSPRSMVPPPSVSNRSKISRICFGMSQANHDEEILMKLPGADLTELSGAEQGLS